MPYSLFLHIHVSFPFLLYPSQVSVSLIPIYNYIKGIHVCTAGKAVYFLGEKKKESQERLSNLSKDTQ